MMVVSLSGVNGVVKSLNKYQLQKRQAVAQAINRGILRIRNDLVVSMKKTPRKVFGPHLPPPTEGLGEGGANVFGEMKRRKGRKLLEKGGSKPHINRRGGEAHAASMPGFPPAIDTGRLVNSLRLDYANTVTPPAYLVAELSTAVKYAPKLEYGLKSGKRRAAARPAWRPAFHRQLPRIREEIRAAFGGKGIF